MYAQVQKPKDNISRTAANSIAQKKNRRNQSFGFVDNRPEAVAQLIRVASYNQTLLSSSTEVVQKESYSSNRLDNGSLEVDEQEGLISIIGTFNKENQEVQDINATLEFKIDDRDNTRVVIGNIKATPKRTGAGSVLVFHLAKWASDAGKKWIGTDLSALEEGTPEFYKAIGLNPDPDPEILKY